MLEMLQDIFYGDTWYIAWGAVGIPFIISLVVQIKQTVKSIKMKQQKKN